MDPNTNEPLFSSTEDLGNVEKVAEKLVAGENEEEQRREGGFEGRREGGFEGGEKGGGRRDNVLRRQLYEEGVICG